LIEKVISVLVKVLQRNVVYVYLKKCIGLCDYGPEIPYKKSGRLPYGTVVENPPANTGDIS